MDDKSIQGDPKMAQMIEGGQVALYEWQHEESLDVWVPIQEQARLIEAVLTAAGVLELLRIVEAAQRLDRGTTLCWCVDDYECVFCALSIVVNQP